jgi:hypothetical protein
MSKRGRKASWWGYSYFSETNEKNPNGNALYQCQAPTGVDKEGKPVLCCELISYLGSPTPLKTHLSTRHREWHAKIKAEKAGNVKEKKQQKLTEVGVEVKQESSAPRAASAEEKRELDEDLLGYVVDDLRGVSSVEGISFFKRLTFLSFSYYLRIGKGFKRLVRRGRPVFPDSMFKREHVVELIHDEAHRDRNERIPIYKLTAADRSLTTDFYTAKNQAEIMVLTSHGFNAFWQLEPIVLGGRASSVAHTGTFSLLFFTFFFLFFLLHYYFEEFLEFKSDSNRLGDEIEKIIGEIHDPWSDGRLPFRIVRDQAANGKKGVRQYFAEAPPRPNYDGNDCICHIVDREFKTTLQSSPLAPVFAQQHKIVAYFKKSNKANNYLMEAQMNRLEQNASYFQDRAEALGWNSADSWVEIPSSKKPLKFKISMPVRWWSDIDEVTRFILLEEVGSEAISRVRKDLKKKGKLDKRDMLKLPDRDREALRRSVSALFPVKVCIKELEGPFLFSFFI